jgi:hypothetical protein
VKERYKFGRDYMVERVGKYFKTEGLPDDLAAKYRHYFAVHETEAWLISHPGSFPIDIRNSLRTQKPPEQINLKTPPATLLNELYLKSLSKGIRKLPLQRIFSLG